MRYQYFYNKFNKYPSVKLNSASDLVQMCQLMILLTVPRKRFAHFWNHNVVSSPSNVKTLAGMRLTRPVVSNAKIFDISLPLNPPQIAIWNPNWAPSALGHNEQKCKFAAATDPQ